MSQKMLSQRAPKRDEVSLHPNQREDLLKFEESLRTTHSHWLSVRRKGIIMFLAFSQVALSPLYWRYAWTLETRQVLALFKNMSLAHGFFEGFHSV